MNTIMVTGIKSISQQQVSAMGLSGITAATVTQMPSQEMPVKRTTASDARRSNKPIMEKRRRARINNCLNELKSLILDAMKKDPARHSKLEKADILEMTVKYLQNHQLNLQRQQVAMSQAADATIASKMKAGFVECANEVGRYPGLDPQVKRRLLQHLGNCINGVKQEQHVLPSPPSSPEQESSNGYYLTNGSGNGVQLIPTKLPDGNIAFVLPQSVSNASTPLPMLVPIPSRTASTGSATSSNYERLREQSTSPTAYNAPPSPANSSYHEAMDVCTPASAHQQFPPQTLANFYQQRSYSPSQAPLSLVMKKTNFDQQMKDDEKPWRPW